MRVAIVGAGVSGLSALWLLNEYSDHEVNIYEREDYPGGHTHTVEFKREGKESCMVDTGFIVANPPTYPNFLRFLKLLKIPILDTQMTFSVSRDRGAFEWAGDGLGALFCQVGNLFNPRLYRMIFDIVRFNLFALDLLKEPLKDGKEISIGEYLDREGYGDGFKEDYLLPMTGAIWSTPADQAALDFPASTLIRFFHNHHLLQLTGKPSWLTIKGGAKQYIDAVLSRLPKENLHLNTEIVSVSSREDGVELVEAGGARHIYDHVILATHSDTTLNMLKRGGLVTPEEEKVLAPWGWSKNEAVLHWDDRFIPVRRKAYSAWNYLTSTSKPHRDAKTTDSEVDTVSLTYGMNILQHLPESKYGLVLVTLNPPFPVDPAKTIGSWTYTHPMMTTTSVSTQPHLPSIQNKRNISYAGAWTKYGFHEDGFTSGMRLVTGAPFNVKPPFPLLPATRSTEQSGVGLAVGKGVVNALESSRRFLTPAWGVVEWTVVLGLVWLEQVFGALGLDGTKIETRRVRDAWSGKVSAERKSQ
ncbi:hypothetical protein DB88DRAFT_490915 [Papiliotrema laurentii]|uniref:Amine oxidase domain-containing protein n=1 Tax=Papiliotrema laurentii TaxID=5418 RepID=A0AAD9D1W9_PAPLA|nr:hypothetical protein DB88DRAFT_490915 [Papiliotrema laurentii]